MLLSDQLRQYGFVREDLITRVQALEASHELTHEVSSAILAQCEAARPRLAQLEVEKLGLLSQMEDELHLKIQQTGKNMRVEAEELVHADEEKTAEVLLNPTLPSK